MNPAASAISEAAASRVRCSAPEFIANAPPPVDPNKSGSAPSACAAPVTVSAIKTDGAMANRRLCIALGALAGPVESRSIATRMAGRRSTSNEVAGRKRKRRKRAVDSLTATHAGHCDMCASTSPMVKGPACRLRCPSTSSNGSPSAAADQTSRIGVHKKLLVRRA